MRSNQNVARASVTGYRGERDELSYLRASAELGGGDAGVVGSDSVGVPRGGGGHMHSAAAAVRAAVGGDAALLGASNAVARSGHVVGELLNSFSVRLALSVFNHTKNTIYVRGWYRPDQFRQHENSQGACRKKFLVSHAAHLP